MPNDDKDLMTDHIKKVRDDLQKAVDRLDDSERPPNACGSHDVIFQTSKATAAGVDALLAIQSLRISSSSYDSGSFRAACVKNIKFLAIVAACALCFLTAIGKFDFQQAVTEWIQRHADNRSAYQYEASDSKN